MGAGVGASLPGQPVDDFVGCVNATLTTGACVCTCGVYTSMQRAHPMSPLPLTTPPCTSLTCTPLCTMQVPAFMHNVTLHSLLHVTAPHLQ